MDNEFIDDDDGEEIIDIDFGQYMFTDPSMDATTSSDESNSANEQSQSADSRSNSESVSVNLTPDEIKLLNEYSLDKHSKELCSKAGTGDLVTCLHKHWQKYVPICFNAMDVPKRNLIETDTHKILLKPLEIYICNNNDSDTILNKLNELDDPPQLCGKVFKAGEPSYFCRDCGSDPTCVLCSNCFRKSKHREHRYKMMTSGGGGYCDCGDPEAWKKHPNCELHTPKTTQTNEEESSENYINKLPQDLAQRATGLFTLLLDYIKEILTIENSEELPSHLKPENPPDDYVTMLYNDEVHSYDQVVSTLKKVLTIDENKAFEYAAVVDKEGRSTIKRGKKAESTQIKTKVETVMGGPLSNPLETKVMHHSLVAHQYFAEKIIVWLQKICDSSKGLKHILCKIGLFSKPPEISCVEKLMLNDSIFWKSARAIMHQFYISVYFMDPYWKREFAVLYTKNYRTIWSNHVKNPDDTVSLTDLAVQMFTVISLSKYLLKKYNLLQVIMVSLISHSKTTNGKLSFPRSRQRNNPEFKRAQYMLFDLKYCLTAAPDEWDDQLRKNFINGFSSFVEFLKFMHGMDSLERYTQQHVEFEPEWETSFNLLIKLQKSIMSLIEWSSSDKLVFFECYKLILNAINNVETTEPLFNYKYEKRKFNGQQYEIIDYNVLKQKVSIHAPLTRLFAAVYSQLEKYSLNFNTISPLLAQNSSNPLSTIKGDLPKQKMIALLEPSLRALVLVSQTNAGLWKRNGFSLLSQVYFYSNIKCRQEMFDRDILCLQMGASQMDPNEFLINLLNHFGLLTFFTDDSFEIPADNQTDELKQDHLIPVTEDFLELLIYILSERYEPYLSQTEASKKLERECIHQLCVSPQPHSDLVKNIYPDNEKYTNELESVLSRIAVFKSGTGANAKGVYELKPEYLSYYSPYFYHYSRPEKTKSEEYQLSLRKNDKEKFFKPPRLPPLTDLYANMSHLLDSDVFIKIVFCVLRRYSSKSKICSDGQLIRILHLIGLALHEEQDDVDKNIQNENVCYSFKFLDKSIINNSKKAVGLFSIKSFKVEESLTKYLSESIAAITTEPYKLLAEWALDYSQRLLKLKHKIDQQKNDEAKSSSAEAKTSSAAVADDSSVSDEQKQIEKRKHQIAEKRRAKVMAQLSQMQKNFISNHKEFYDETKLSSASSYESSISRTDSHLSRSSLSSDFDMLKEEKPVVCIGPNQTPKTELIKKRYQCILCQEDEEVAVNKAPMVLCCYVSNSKVLSKNRADIIEDFDKFDPLFQKSVLNIGISTTSCGHVMHSGCWQKYVDTVKLAESRRHARYHGFNIKRNEFLCPLCETIGNTVLPLFPDIREFTQPASTIAQELISPEDEKMIEESSASSSKSAAEIQRKRIDLSYDDWLDGLEKTLENSVQKELKDDKDVFIINPCPLSTITKLMADAVASNFKSLFEFESLIGDVNNLIGFASNSTQSDNKLHNETINTIENFTRHSYTFGFVTFPNDDDYRMPISMWLNCSYTISVIEQLLRGESKPLFGQLTLKQIHLLSNIVKQAALYGINKNQESVRKSCVNLLAGILPYKTAVFDSKNIMELDMFYLLVALTLSMPNLYDQPKLNSVASGGLNDLNVFKLVLQAHCVQILITKIKLNTFYDRSSSIEMSDANGHETNALKIESYNDKKVYEFYQFILDSVVDKGIIKLSNEDKSRLLYTPNVIYDSLKQALMPFLRCSTLFFANLTDLEPINEITSKEYDLDRNFDTLIKFLGISENIGDLLDIKSNTLKILCDSWINKISIEKQLRVDYPMKINEFIELPNDFVDLISMSMSSHVCSSRTSSLIDASSESATILCLICGEMLCSQQFCCQEEIFKNRVGSCTAHAYKCGGTTGMFLRVSECQVLQLHLNISSREDFQVRGCFSPAPYLDNYGETDQGLRRGNPLYLCKTRYDKLYKDWLSHAIPEEVSRSYQNQTSMINVNWMEL